MPIDLTDQDLQDAAQACRALAFTHSLDVDRQSNPDIKERFRRTRDRMTKLAEKFEAARSR